jgi:transcriptional regulator with XRE-family HTH domain
MQFAESVDISVPFLSEIENGKKSMSQEILHRICSTHHVSADYILFGYENNTCEQINVELEQIPVCYHPIIIEYIRSISKLLETSEANS